MQDDHSVESTSFLSAAVTKRNALYRANICGIRLPSDKCRIEARDEHYKVFVGDSLVLDTLLMDSATDLEKDLKEGGVCDSRRPSQEVESGVSRGPEEHPYTGVKDEVSTGIGLMTQQLHRESTVGFALPLELNFHDSQARASQHR